MPDKHPQPGAGARAAPSLDLAGILVLPLQGCQLIEASAGTGKTWTLAALVLRAVLGIGLPEPLPLRRILVLSFTVAATQELRERIRRWLHDAAAAFAEALAAPEASATRCSNSPSLPGDPWLATLLQAHPSLAARVRAQALLAAAADSIDDAAIHTLDAWCQKVLHEHALECGVAPDTQLLADESAWFDEAVADVWRQQVYPLPDALLPLVLARVKDPAALRKALGALPRLGDVVVAQARTGLSLAQVMEAERAALATLKDGWPARIARMREWLDARLGRKDGPIDGRKLRREWTQLWLDALQAWATQADSERPDLGKTAPSRLRPEGMAEVFRPGQAEALPSEFSDFAALMDSLAAHRSLAAVLLTQLAAAVQQRLAARKAELASAGFADLQARLAAALDPARGEPATRLRAALLARQPLALIDEFQDSSPLQLAIAERLYGFGPPDGSAAAPGLVLIGDPKQSIYRFRGADIHGYLRVRQAVAERRHSLAHNRRSTTALVASVNAAFARAEHHEAEGAFRFGRLPSEVSGTPGPAALPFEPAQAVGRDDRIEQGGVALPALQIAFDPIDHKVAESRWRLASACAVQVVAWLADEGTRLHSASESPRRLRPADIAVLVRSAAEAQPLRQALAERGVPSVYLSEQTSVFASAEAAGVLALLRAVAEPRDLAALRRLLASAWVGHRLPQLAAWAQQDGWLEATVEQMLALQTTWRQRGVLAMVREAMHGLASPSRWQRDDGERALTNSLHLAELLQAAPVPPQAEAGLVRWLVQAIADAGRPGGTPPDEQVQRLASDADCVRIVTVHKSKGLQYRLVCLPFFALGRGKGPRPSMVVRASNGAQARQAVFGPDAEAAEQDQREDERESLRLLYVALTRAEHGLWLGVGLASRAPWSRSALGWLVSGAAELPADEIATALVLWIRDMPGARLLAPWPGAQAGAEPPLQRWVDVQQPPPLAPPRLPRPRPAATWSVGSYSGFVRGLETPAARGWRDDEPAANHAAAPSEGAAAARAPWHRHPRGSAAGQRLHEELEWLSHEHFAPLRAPTAWRQRLEAHMPVDEAADVVAWLGRVATTPLPPLGVALVGLQRCWPELEFWLPTEALDAQRLDRLCQEHILPGQPRPELPARALRGLLMGFADLVWQHGGRFGVIDHKSNALGDDDSAYSDAALARAVLDHRYDVQGALYLLALHRLLRLRLGAAYRPAEQLHGALFLFLRGVAATNAGAWLLRPSAALMEGLDAMFSGAVPA